MKLVHAENNMYHTKPDYYSAFQPLIVHFCSPFLFALCLLPSVNPDRTALTILSLVLELCRNRS